jgi:hypothetical protein
MIRSQPDDVEKLANELCALRFENLSQAETDAKILAIVGDLVAETSREVLDRAAVLVRERAAAAVKHVEMLETIERLARATHCPDGADAATWLLELGLVERDGLAYRLTPRAGVRAV